MFSIFKRKGDHPEVPEWASFFNEKEYQEFIKAVDNYFVKKKLSYEQQGSMLVVGENNFGFSQMGLVNVAQVCKQDKTAVYEKIVSRHFETMIRANEFESEFEKIVTDYDKVKKYIGVRIYPADYATNIGEDFTLGKSFAGDTYAMLVFDLPDSIANIKPEQADKWGKTVEELIETGIENIKQNYPFEISKQKFNDFDIWFVQGDHFFTPNIVFDLENHPKMIGSKGALIGMPHRHAVIIYPIESIDIIKAINGLIPTIYGMNQEGPGSVSNKLLWYKDGQFVNLPYNIQEQKLQFIPPAEFVELLNTLA